MKTAFRIFVAMLILSGWGLAGSALHVVWTGDSPIIIPKDRIGVRDTYVDVSKWTADDVANHPAVALRLVRTGKADALKSAFKATSQQDLIDQINDAIAKGPTTAPSAGVIEKIASTAKSVTAH